MCHSVQTQTHLKREDRSADMQCGDSLSGNVNVRCGSKTPDGLHVNEHPVEDGSDQRSHSAPVVEDPAPASVDDNASLADNPSFLATLDNLDRDVIHALRSARTRRHPPLEAYLVAPDESPDLWRTLTREGHEAVNNAGGWIAAIVLALGLVLGASLAAFVFRERFSTLFLLW